MKGASNGLLAPFVFLMNECSRYCHSGLDPESRGGLDEGG